jgi:hypothetical protein
MLLLVNFYYNYKIITLIVSYLFVINFGILLFIYYVNRIVHEVYIAVNAYNIYSIAVMLGLLYIILFINKYIRMTYGF